LLSFAQKPIVQLASMASIGGFGLQAFPVTTPLVKLQSGYRVAVHAVLDPPALFDPPVAVLVLPPVLALSVPPVLPPAPPTVPRASASHLGQGASGAASGVPTG